VLRTRFRTFITFCDFVVGHTLPLFVTLHHVTHTHTTTVPVTVTLFLLLHHYTPRTLLPFRSRLRYTLLLLFVCYLLLLRCSTAFTHYVVVRYVYIHFATLPRSTVYWVHTVLFRLIVTAFGLNVHITSSTDMRRCSLSCGGAASAFSGVGGGCARALNTARA